MASHGAFDTLLNLGSEPKIQHSNALSERMKITMVAQAGFEPANFRLLVRGEVSHIQNHKVCNNAAIMWESVILRAPLSAKTLGAENDPSPKRGTRRGICGNTPKIPFRKHVFWCNPGSTNTLDIGQRQPVHRGFSGDAPRRAEHHIGEWRGQRLKIPGPTCRGRREEFHGSKAICQ